MVTIPGLALFLLAWALVRRLLSLLGITDFVTRKPTISGNASHFQSSHLPQQPPSTFPYRPTIQLLLSQSWLEAKAKALAAKAVAQRTRLQRVRSRTAQKLDFRYAYVLCLLTNGHASLAGPLTSPWFYRACVSQHPTRPHTTSDSNPLRRHFESSRILRLQRNSLINTNYFYASCRFRMHFARPYYIALRLRNTC